MQHTKPLDRMITSKQVYWSGLQHRWRANPHIPVCRSGEEHLVENYDSAKKENFRGWICHHRLELTLDGEFANSMIGLVNKDMYFNRPYYELIWMKREEHSSIHSKAEIRRYDREVIGWGCRPGQMPPNLFMEGEKNPRWLGDNAKPGAKYKRALKLYRANQISEEEFQVFRNDWVEYKKQKK